MRRTPELLAPAGDLAAVYAAVSAGADAVYFGGKAFNARASAGNLDENEIAEAARVCRRHGVRTFLTLNTLIKEDEWEAFKAYTQAVLPLGIDAVIVQDIAAADYIRTVWPDVELHASTQMAVHDADGVRFLFERGFKRVVLARELSIEEIRAIHKACPVELEVFIHGALCCSYSGRCLLSSFHGGRSGNRGQCAGACRLPYTLGGRNGYPMNLKDLCTLDLLPELMEAGIASFKIEGRLKGIPYIYGVTSVYRKYMDLYFASPGAVPVDPADREKLAQLYNRGDFTDGYLRNSKERMLEPSSPKHQGLRIGKVREVKGSQLVLEVEKACSAGDVLEIRTDKPPFPTIRLSQAMICGKEIVYKAEKGPKPGDAVYRLTDALLGDELLRDASAVPDAGVFAEAWIYTGRPMKLTLRNEITGCMATVTGSVPERALGRALSEEDLIRSLSKLGGSGYSLSGISVHTDESSFVPVSAINALRREALTALDTVPSRVPVPYGQKKPNHSANGGMHISFETKEQWQAILEVLDEEGAVLMPACALDEPKLAKQSLEKGFVLVPYLPYVTRGRNLEKESQRTERWISAGASGFEAHHLGQVNRIREHGLSPYFGWGFGIMNLTAAQLVQQAGAMAFVVSPELSAEETEKFASADGASLYAYGHIPLMITEQCFHRSARGCEPSVKPHITNLTDRIGAALIAQSSCDYCYNVLYDEKPVYLGDKKPASLNRRLSFTVESGEETAKVLRFFLQRKPFPESGRGHYNSKVI